MVTTAFFWQFPCAVFESIVLSQVINRSLFLVTQPKKSANITEFQNIRFLHLGKMCYFFQRYFYKSYFVNKIIIIVT